MNPSDLPLTPRRAWQPLPSFLWDETTARHFLRRLCFYVDPEQLAEAVSLGPRRMFVKLFNQNLTDFPPPAAILEWEQSRDAYREQIRAVGDDPEGRQEIQRTRNRLRNQGHQDLACDWLAYARQPSQGARENWVQFLANIFVVSANQVNEPALIFRHQEILRQNARGTLGDLAKAVSRSPAMIEYLDLQRSSAQRPNENFARELFELFLLGEGNYTEEDVREAARAFTGYRQREGEFHRAERQVDRGRKRIFGRLGEFDGDHVIDIALQQPAARTYLPRQVVQWYLSSQPLPDPYYEELGRLWERDGFQLDRLLERVVTSALFYDTRFPGSLIKSPVRLYLGLVGDLRLDVPPFPRPVVNTFRFMGQPLFRPPNVRGWVGGPLWINASTLNARRQLVESLFQPWREDRLNADELLALQAARRNGPVTLTVTRERLEQIAEEPAEVIVDHFLRFFLARPPQPFLAQTLTRFLDQTEGGARWERVRDAAIGLLHSPDYQLI